MTSSAASTSTAAKRGRLRLPREATIRAASSAALWGGFVLGIVLLVYSYSVAAHRPNHDQLHFHLFWAGELVFLTPALVRLLKRGTARRDRLVLLVAVAVFGAIPKYLRDPSFPIFHDELIHSREASAVLATGKPFQPSPLIGVIQFFPGLHTLAASLAAMSGARLFVIEVTLLVVLRILLLIGMFVLVERITRSSQLGALAAFFYAANPSFLYFDAQFAYESLAIVLIVWVLAAVAALQTDNRGRAWGWTFLAAIVGCACVVTHHISTYSLCAVLVVVAALSLVAARRGTLSRPAARLSTLVAGTVVAASLGWALLVASGVTAYLAPSILGGISQMARLIQHEQQSRVLFAKSFNPSYERDAAFAGPVLALIAAGYAILRAPRGWIRSPIGTALLVLGLAYFAAIPFIYTQAGNEGARRSWGYSYIGVSLLLALAARTFSSAPARPLARSLCAVVFAVVLVGNVSATLNSWYRFPGPVSSQSDVRLATPELRAAARWFRGSEGGGQNVVTDVPSSPTFAFFGDAFPSTPSNMFPAWDLFLSADPPPPKLASQMATSHVDYVVINRLIPNRLTYYVTYDVSRGAKERAAPGSLHKFDQVRWSSKLYASNHIAIYRVDDNLLKRIGTGIRAR